MLYCRLIYMLSILCVRLTIKVKVGIPESIKVGWYPPKKTGSSHLNTTRTKVVHMVNKAKSVAIENELEEKKQSSRLSWKALKKR